GLVDAVAEPAPAEGEEGVIAEAETAPAGDGDAPAGKGEPAPPKPLYNKVTIPCEMVLALDSMGLGRGFDEEDILTTKSWASKLATALEAVEQKLFVKECEILPQLNAADAIAAVEARKAEDAAAREAALADLTDATDADKEAKTIEMLYAQATRGVESAADGISLLSKLSLPVKPEG
ncbi:unnamed protein product, partial [Chrysoparadoxa australica]